MSVRVLLDDMRGQCWIDGAMTGGVCRGGEESLVPRGLDDRKEGDRGVTSRNGSDVIRRG